ncbi:MAG: hypothetical protein COB78_08035 [Hyphomicrobiales bacterium]|nr:MAG: hypothetical protein COB78_08035 [Hyphomicrobiales bacterium]
MTLLLGKIFVSVFVVLGLSWVAEHVNPRIAGILSGMPLGAVLILFFVGIELGPQFAAESALYAIPSLVGTISFAIGYYWGTLSNNRYSPLISTVTGVTCFFVVASALSMVEFNLITGACLSLITLGAVGYVFHSHDTNKIQNKIRMTFPRMLFRSGMAAGFVVAITTLADAIGSQWSGLLIGFPMVFLPFLLIIHITYSGAQVRTIIRSFPLGLVSLIGFLMVAAETIPIFGVNMSILISLCAAFTYLTALSVVLRRLKPAPVES